MQHIEAFAATLRRGPRAGGKMRVHCTAFALITLATTSLLGCTRHVQVKDYDEPAPTPAVAGPIVLEVENHNWSDVVLSSSFATEPRTVSLRSQLRMTSRSKSRHT
ncbi:MAG: hypothetical protein ACJ792_00685 [Gemmatimonadaceae bacterium]